MRPPKDRFMVEAPRTPSDEPTSPALLPSALPVEAPELEIRRCLRHAIVLLAETDASPERRLMLLGGASHWVRAALAGIDRLARDAEREMAMMDTQDVEVPAPREPLRRCRLADGSIGDDDDPSNR
jgi:hypothetical protein